MSLARPHIRKCLIWRNLGKQFGTEKGGKLWQAFYDCLEATDSPRETELVGGPPRVEVQARRFLSQLLDVASLDARGLDAQLRQELAAEPSALDLLARWQARDVVDQLFEQPIEHAAALFYLGQMAYIGGRLRTAKDCAVSAYTRLPLATVLERSETPPPALVILELLIMTLVLEINFFAAGRRAVSTADPKHIFRESLRALQQGKDKYLKDFVEAADHEVVQDLVRRDPAKATTKAQSAGLSEQAQALIEVLTTPIFAEDLIEEGEISAHLEPGEMEPLALAFELSRKNHVGMLHFRLRNWPEARASFETVLAAIRLHLEAGHQEGQAILNPLELEAEVFLGRLDAQRCAFASAEARLMNAAEKYHAMGDAFAENKARKYLGETKYRQLAWIEAEALFLEVLHTSQRLGFDHDAAAAESFLGKIYSRFGFQDWASDLFESARNRLAKGGLHRELVENIFWQATAQARRIDFEGHPREAVANAEAMLQIYEQLFRAVAPESANGSRARSPWAGHLQALREVTLQERHPDLLRAMLELIRGRLPRKPLVDALRGHALRQVDARAGWQGEAHAFLCHQIVRLILIQKAASQEANSCIRSAHLARSKELSKYFVREAFIASFEALVYPQSWCSRDICARTQETYRLRAELHLRGGFVPSLVDISQFFTDRTCFVGLLLLIQLAIEEGLRESPEATLQERLDPEILKDVHRSITKYLNLERNFYVGPPDFTRSRNPKLWHRLQQRKHQGASWKLLHERALAGRFGLTYPSHAVALGWVDTVDHASATLAVTWIDDQLGRPLTEDSFTPLVVPIEVVRAGHAEESLAPIVLLGRSSEPDDGRGEWVAHRLAALDKWQLFAAKPYNQPRLEVWQQVFSRFVGGVPARCNTPVVAPNEVSRRYQHYVNEWFADRLPPGLLQQVFGRSSPKPRRKKAAEPLKESPQTPALEGQTPGCAEQRRSIGEMAIMQVWSGMRGQVDQQLAAA